MDLSRRKYICALLIKGLRHVKVALADVVRAPRATALRPELKSDLQVGNEPNPFPIACAPLDARSASWRASLRLTLADG